MKSIYDSIGPNILVFIKISLCQGFRCEVKGSSIFTLKYLRLGRQHNQSFLLSLSVRQAVESHFQSHTICHTHSHKQSHTQTHTHAHTHKFTHTIRHTHTQRNHFYAQGAHTLAVITGSAHYQRLPTTIVPVLMGLM